MAINKKQTPPIVKVGIIGIAAVMVLAFTLPLISPTLFSGGTATNTAATEQSQYDTVAAQYTGSIDAFQAQLESDPTSFTVLVNLGNTYSNWGQELFKTQNGVQPASQPVWTASATYYGQALAVQPGDPAVTTDYAISLFYSGQTNNAIAAVESVMAENPDFAPAFFNAGIFYSNAGRPAEAASAMGTFLVLDPQGTSGDLATAQSVIDEAAAAPVTTP